MNSSEKTSKSESINTAIDNDTKDDVSEALEKKEKNQRSLIRPYFQAIPDIWRFQLLTKATSGVIFFLLYRLAMVLINSTGRVAITSGDFLFLFTSWQGILLILLGLVTLLIYIVFDINSTILMSERFYRGEKIKVFPLIIESFGRMRGLLTPGGLALVAFITVFVPLIGIGLSISLTRNFYIPTFISSVIKDNALYNAIYTVVIIILTAIGILGIFTMHGIILDHLTVKDSFKRSYSYVRSNWKMLLKETGRYLLRLFLVMLILIILYAAGCLAGIFVLDGVLKDLDHGLLFFLAVGSLLFALFNLLQLSFYAMKLTQLYHILRDGKYSSYPLRKPKFPLLQLIEFVVLLFMVFWGSYFVDLYLDQMFDRTVDKMIIAHRGAGNEGIENTVSSIDKAYELKAYGSEIDVQRTADGYYVLNHDGTFKRAAGVDRKVNDMTLAEIMELDLGGEKVARIEDVLDRSRDKVVLFIELKGETADRQMADDVIAMVKQRDMIDQCVFISLKYDLIDYIESNYSDIQTGYLTFASFGETARLNCDYIGLEEEAASFSVISAIHEHGKKVLIWTVNEEDSQRHFLLSEADGIITDNVSQIKELIVSLNERTNFEFITDLFTWH